MPLGRWDLRAHSEAVSVPARAEATWFRPLGAQGSQGVSWARAAAPSPHSRHSRLSREDPPCVSSLGAPGREGGTARHISGGPQRLPSVKQVQRMMGAAREGLYRGGLGGDGRRSPTERPPRAWSRGQRGPRGPAGEDATGSVRPPGTLKVAEAGGHPPRPQRRMRGHWENSRCAHRARSKATSQRSRRQETLKV